MVIIMNLNHVCLRQKVQVLRIRIIHDELLIRKLSNTANAERGETKSQQSECCEESFIIKINWCLIEGSFEAF